MLPKPAIFLVLRVANRFVFRYFRRESTTA
jgi:hypothetical protein